MMDLRVAMLSVHTSPLEAIGQSVTAGGLNIYVKELSRSLGKLGVKVDIFTQVVQGNDEEITELDEGVRVINIPGCSLKVAKEDLYSYLPIFADKVKSFVSSSGVEYDILHSHYWLSGLAGLILAKNFSIPHVTMFHTVGRLKQKAFTGQQESPLRLYMEKEIISETDAITVATENERNQLLQLFKVEPNKIRVIPGGVDLSHFNKLNKNESRKKLSLGIDHQTILFVGRLDPFKGTYTLLKSVSEMVTKPQVLLIGGSGEKDTEVQNLKKYASQLSILDQITFIRAVPQSDLPLYYSAADVTVVPSYYESFGLVAIESLACGTPVVAANVGGLPLSIQDGFNGILTSEVTSEHFANALDKLLQNETLLKSLAENARISVIKYSWKEAASRAVKLYLNLKFGVTECCLPSVV